jgi:hypothetical protein
MVRPSPERRGAEEHLGIADRHLAEATDRLHHLEGSVLPRLARDGRACALAAELLETMHRSRELMVEHRRLAAELAGVAGPGPDGP